MYGHFRYMILFFIDLITEVRPLSIRNNHLKMGAGKGVGKKGLSDKRPNNKRPNNTRPNNNMTKVQIIKGLMK